MNARPWLALALVYALGCTEPMDDDDTAGDDDDTAADDDDTAADDDTAGDDDTEDAVALAGRYGQALADESGYDGVEELYWIADAGAGEDLCRVRYELRSTGEIRTDCDDCAWAFDMVLDQVAVVAESGPGCAGMGLDVGALGDGLHDAYGYAPDYFGHAQILMADAGSGWNAATFASWDEASLSFEYDWEQGHQSYPPE